MPGTPKPMRLGEREQFADAFARYLAAPPEISRPAVPLPANPINTGRDVGRIENSGTASEAASVTPKPHTTEQKGLIE